MTGVHDEEVFAKHCYNKASYFCDKTAKNQKKLQINALCIAIFLSVSLEWLYCRMRFSRRNTPSRLFVSDELMTGFWSFIPLKKVFMELNLGSLWLCGIFFNETKEALLCFFSVPLPAVLTRVRPLA
jgi:hypothetical protein